MSDLLKRLEVLETAKAAVRARAPKSEADAARLTFSYLLSLRSEHPELVPLDDSEYWPCAHGSQDDIPLENLTVLARVDPIAKLLLTARERMLTSQGHDLL